jgi:hypothetical protein
MSGSSSECVWRRVAGLQPELSGLGRAGRMHAVPAPTRTCCRASVRVCACVTCRAWRCCSYNVPGKRNSVVLHCSLQRASGRMLVHTLESSHPTNDHVSLPQGCVRVWQPRAAGARLRYAPIHHTVSDAPCARRVSRHLVLAR